MHEEKFKEIHERYRHSGLTVKDFCHNEGIAKSRFYYWQKKLKNCLSNVSIRYPPVYPNEKTLNGCKSVRSLSKFSWRFFYNVASFPFTPPSIVLEVILPSPGCNRYHIRGYG